MKSYSDDQARALIRLAHLLKVQVYEQTIMGDLEAELRHRLLAEYGTPFDESGSEQIKSGGKFKFPFKNKWY